jgi:hypothetical protein
LIGVQKVQYIENLTPTLLVRLLRKKRAIALAITQLAYGLSIFSVAGAIYGPAALLNTMETVAGEKPLKFATSLIVTASALLDERFTILLVAASSGKFMSDCNGAVFTSPYSAGASNDIALRNPEVFQAPYNNPMVSHAAPRIFAGVLNSHQI